MEKLTTGPSSHLAKLSEAEIAHLLRGFPDTTLSAALTLRSGDDEQAFISFLFGIVAFYLPAGTRPPENLPSDEIRLREDLGLDSLALAEAMFKVEELFAVTVGNSEIAAIETLADARRLLKEKLGSPEAGGAHA